VIRSRAADHACIPGRSHIASGRTGATAKPGEGTGDGGLHGVLCLGIESTNGTSAM